jgi:hypothetical protein
MRIGTFIILFAVVLAFTTLTSRQGGISNGAQTFISYGWPQPWLHADIVGVDVTGRSYDRVRTDRTIDWRVFSISGGIAACIAALLSAPLCLSPFKRFAGSYARVLLVVVAGIAIAWAVHPLLTPRHGLQTSDGSWQIFVRFHYPACFADPAWFASGVRWSQAEAAIRFSAVVVCSFFILWFSTFKRRRPLKKQDA